MKRNKDWTDVMRSALRDAEATPPADGWARLERELESLPAAAPRVPAWRIYMPRVAAAAAAVLICIVAGEVFWSVNRDPDFNLPVVASIEVTEADEPAAELSELIAAEPVVLAAASHRSADPTLRTVRREASAARVIATPSLAAEAAAIAAAPQPVAESALQPAAQEAAQDTSSPQTRRSAESVPGVQKSAAVAPKRSTLFDDDKFVAYVQPRKKTAFSLFAGGGVTSSNKGPGLISRSLAEVPADPDSEEWQELRRQDYEQSSFRHHQPLSFGLSVRKEFAHGLSLETGVNYTLLWSDVRMPFGSEDFSQKLHFIGVPLRVNWNFLERKRFLLYIGAGGMVETCVAAKFGSTRVNEPGAFWSVMGAAGAEYRLGEVVGLYFEPEVSYYFNKTRLTTSRTDSPATFTLRLGVRLSF